MKIIAGKFIYIMYKLHDLDSELLAYYINIFMDNILHFTKDIIRCVCK